MQPGQALLLFSAAALGGAINSIAGGGTLVVFPAALILGGLSPRVASATSAVALTPAAMAAAWAYRRELEGKLRQVLELTLPAILGGLIGAWLLRVLAERVFEMIVPWMLLLASALIVAKDVVFRGTLRAREQMSRKRDLILACGIFLISIYAGYFGAGKNIMLLALLSIFANLDIIKANAIKSGIVSLFMIVISVYFLATGAADQPTALVMALGASAGSFGGASLAMKLKPVLVRYAVVGIGVTLSAVLAYQKFTA